MVMGQQGKILVTKDGTFDLSTYRWDDKLFSNLLIRENPINSDQAMSISRSLREEILQMELRTITVPLLEEIVEAIWPDQDSPHQAGGVVVFKGRAASFG
jgi:ribonucleoside-diphosphate reductase alpha chain